MQPRNKKIEGEPNLCIRDALSIFTVHRSDKDTSAELENGFLAKERKNDHLSILTNISWYDSIPHTLYKVHSEEFKRIFKDAIPPEEQLISAYTCDIYVETLLRGRLYISQNYFSACFLKPEPTICVRWKEVTAIKKEESHIVLINPITIFIGSKKYTFESLGCQKSMHQRFFHIWQSAFLDKPLPVKDMWDWIHTCYGDGIDISDEDENCIFDGQVSQYSSIKEKENISGETSSEMNDGIDNMAEKKVNGELHVLKTARPDMLPTDVTDNSDSEQDGPDIEVKCPCAHEGRLLVHTTLPISADKLFTMLFTESEFIKDLHVSRKHSDVNYSNWEIDTSTNHKVRKGTMTVHLSQPIGPKTSHVSSMQVLLKCSQPGCLYVIEDEVNNAGIPYADSFYLFTHYCIVKKPNSSNESSLDVYAQIKYRKSVWGFVKSFIEKNCWSGMEEHFNDLLKQLNIESEKNIKSESVGMPNKRKLMRKRRNHVDKNGNEMLHVTLSNDELPTKAPISINTPLSISEKTFSTEQLSWAILIALSLLLMLNGFLFCKLWSLESVYHNTNEYSSLEFYLHRHTPHTAEDWLDLLHNQESSHHNEMISWNKHIKSIVGLLQQVEESLEKLDKNIQHRVSERIFALLKNSLNNERFNNNKNIKDSDEL